MSIRTRVEDALLLWERGRLEGAFLNALVAAAATSRRRFSDRNAVGDGQALKRFLESAHTVKMSVEYRGECQPIEHIMYKWLRCQLIHQGELPVDIEFMTDSEPGTFAVRAGGAPEFVLKLSYGWFHHLIRAVVTAPENVSLFREASAEAATVAHRGRS
jgi:hypothetical protein